MARQEQPKEDLIRDATALVVRGELQVTGDSINDQVVSFGWRADGAASLFFGDEPVYHFNAAGKLRRAHDNGLMKAEDKRLVRMRRERSATEVRLVSTPLSEHEQVAFLSDFAERCDSLIAAIQAGTAHVTRQFPPEPELKRQDLQQRFEQWLVGMEHPVVIALRPNA